MRCAGSAEALCFLTRQSASADCAKVLKALVFIAGFGWLFLPPEGHPQAPGF